MSETKNKFLGKALIFSTVVELILLSISIWFIHEGGIHPGGLFFAILHLPSAFLFAYIAAGLGVTSVSSEIILMVLTALAQFALIAGGAYWILKLLHRIKGSKSQSC